MIKIGKIWPVAVVFLAALLATGWYFWPISDPYKAMAQGHYKRAAELFSPLAKAGDPTAKNALGNLYYLGLGVKRSNEKALALYLEAALLENVDAQINIARHYQYGFGVKRDEMRAFGWLRQARQQRSEIAESYMKWQAGSMTMTPSQMQRAISLYDTLDDLRASLKRDKK